MSKISKNVFSMCFLLVTVMIASLIESSTKFKKVQKAQILAPTNNTIPNLTTPTNKNNTETAAPTKLNAKKAKRTTDINNPTNQDPNVPDFTKANNINCSTNNCQFPNQCSEDKKTCRCGLDNAEYELNKKLKEGETREDPTKVQLFCAYVRKQQLVYFLLEILLNIGAGHFYAGNIGMGVGKLLVVFLPCFAMCIAMCCGMVGGDKAAGGAMAGGSCLGIAAVCAISIWWIVDIIMIATLSYTDGHGVPLKSW